jgi:hypothetical protein
MQVSQIKIKTSACTKYEMVSFGGIFCNSVSIKQLQCCIKSQIVHHNRLNLPKFLNVFFGTFFMHSKK